MCQSLSLIKALHQDSLCETLFMNLELTIKFYLVRLKFVILCIVFSASVAQ